MIDSPSPNNVNEKSDNEVEGEEQDSPTAPDKAKKKPNQKLG